MRIIVEPEGGLANRLRVIESVLAVAQIPARHVEVVWVINRFMGCRFEDLFEMPRGFVALRNVDARSPRGLWYYRAVLPARRLMSDYYRETDCWQLKERGWNYRSADAAVRYFRLCSPFARSDTPYRWLNPVAEIREKVRTFSRERQIGVHIRRTDHAAAIARSPTAQFIQIMSDEVGRDPQAVFFLATDDADEEARIMKQFPDRVRTHPKRSLDRGTREATREAVIDLLVLAGCSRIIGSYGSSFSEVAAEIGAIKLHVIGGEESANR